MAKIANRTSKMTAGKTSLSKSQSLRELLLREKRLLAHLWTVQIERDSPLVRWMSDEEACVDTGNSGLILRTAPQLIVAIDEVGRGCFAGDVTVGVTVWRLEKSFSSGPAHAALLQIVRATKDSKKLSHPKRQQLFADTSSLMGRPRMPGFLVGAQGVDPAAARTAGDFWHPVYGGAPRRSPSPLRFADNAHLDGFIATPESINNWSESDEDLYSHVRECAFVDPQSGSVVDLSEGALELHGCVVGKASPSEIDVLGINAAIWLAISRALSMVRSFSVCPESFHPNHVLCLFDGNEPLRLENDWRDTFQMTLVHGDDALKTIGLASVLAKVERDTLIGSLPEAELYGWKSSKGYGTAEHSRAITQHGLSSHHRRSFLRAFRTTPAESVSADEIAIENAVLNANLKKSSRHDALPNDQLAQRLFKASW